MKLPLWRRKQSEELSEEIRAHLEAAARERMERGESRAAAEAAARREFGNADLVREVTRDQWGWQWLERLLQDTRYGLRQLRRSPGFTLTAILTLALGIGVNLAAFHFLNFLVFRPLPVRDPDSIVRLMPASPRGLSTSVSYPALDYFRRYNTVFTAMLGSAPGELTFGRDPADRVYVKFVTTNFFSELGAAAAYGRLFDPRVDDGVAEPLAVLSTAFWQSRFGSDPGVVGRTIHLNLRPVTVAGIAPYDFTGLDAEDTAVWLPVTSHPHFIEGSRLLADPAQKSMDLFARLKPGVTMAHAKEAMKPLVLELHRQHPQHFAQDEYLATEPGAYLEDLSRAPLPLLGFFAALVLLILVIACANLGNLMLARAVTREREIAIRFAVGASRARLIRQLMTESVLLALLGGAAGIVLGVWAVQLALALIMDVAQFYRFALDIRVFAVALALALLAAVSFGLTPALAATRKGHRVHRARRVLIAAQVAASCVLLIVSGLMVRGLQLALATPPGFDYKDVAAIDPGLGLRGYKGMSALALLEQSRTRLAQVPGVESVAFCSIPPLGGRRAIYSGRVPRPWQAFANDVDPAYFQTLGIPLLRGQNFVAGEQRDVVIVGETLAAKLWPGQDPLGQPFGEPPAEVIAVAGRARTTSLSDLGTDEIYYPLGPKNAESAVLLVKTAGPPDPHLETFRAAVRAQDPSMLPAATLLREAYQLRMRSSGRGTMVVSALGLLAAVLTAIGVYGLLSFVVFERRKEIGIRTALGARRGHVLTLVLRQFQVPVFAGIAIGLAVAAGLSVALRSLLFGLSHLDPLSYAGAVAFFLVLAGAGALVPARRAVRVDPVEVLKYE